jgi:putative ABC transport system permease protein
VSRPRNGGLPARRAVVRWATRMFRREWRQQALIVLLLALTVAGALLQISALYATFGRPEARFGTAEQRMTYDASDPERLAEVLSAARTWFGTIDVIGRRDVPVPGLTRTVELRTQDPGGPYGAAMLRLLDGRYPSGVGEVALTDEVAGLLRVGIGASVRLADRDWTVVGLVENPYDLRQEFVLAPPTDARLLQSVTVLVTADPGQLDRAPTIGDIAPTVEQRDDDERFIASASLLGFVAAAMLLVCFVAVAAFHTMAQRRRRLFGLLAATGATERHVRLVLLAAGAVVGLVAAALGLALAAPVWMVVVPGLENAAAHRIDPLDLPWWLLGACLGLAVITATGAAWWPARAASRLPITQALSQRPPRPKPAHRSAAVGLVLIAAGAVCLRLAHQQNIALIIAGTVAAVVGLPFLGPLAIRLAAAMGARLPVGPRLALRDLARNQARSGAALAAIALALAIPAVVAITTSAQQAANERRAAAGNLSDRQLLIQTGLMGGSVLPDRTPEQMAVLEQAVHRFAAALGAPTVIALDAAMHPDTPLEVDANARPPVTLAAFAQESGPDGVNITLQTPPGTTGVLYLASPDLLRFLGLGTGAFGPGTDVLTTASGGDLRLVFTGQPIRPKVDPMRPVIRPMAPPPYTALPDTLLNPATALAHGWRTVRAGWLVEAAAPLSTDQIAAARDLAVVNGVTVATRDDQASLTMVRAGVTAAGGGLALGILAMTVGLIRGEAARDLRTLTATGATRRMRRTLTAVTAGALTMLGAVLGTAAAYVALIAGYDRDAGLLARVPVLDVVAIIIGVPAVASAAAWLVAGREPRSLVRDP